MVSLVFSCDFSEEMVDTINELRKLRRYALTQQINDIGVTLQHLVFDGVIQLSDINAKKSEILGELSDRLAGVEERLKRPSVIFDDEIELYLNLLGEAN